MDGPNLKLSENVDKFENSGSNHIAMRERNERLVLTILRRQGPLPKADLARKTGLSAQTVSVIMRALERDGLLQKGEKIRGKIGQPSIPMRLAPDGAYFLGLKVGRRSTELTLVNFVGQELAHIHKDYAYPTPQEVLAFVKDAVAELCATLPAAQQARIAGMGVASPYFLWEWANVIGIEPQKMAGWKGFDLAAEIDALVDFPVYLGNDATSACGAELTFGTSELPPDFLYIYIGYFVGGGVVLNGALYAGRAGNAGAVGPFPILSQRGEASQLIDKASMIGLERRLFARTGQEQLSSQVAAEWSPAEHEMIEDWLEDAIPPLTQLIVGACSIIDFPAILIDGNMPDTLRDKIVARVSAALDQMPLSGLIRPDVQAGTLGARARPLGAASLPLSERFMLRT